MIKSHNIQNLKPVILNTENENLPNTMAIVQTCSDNEIIVDSESGDIITVYYGMKGFPKIMVIHNKITGLFSLFTRKDQFSKLVWNH